MDRIMSGRGVAAVGGNLTAATSPLGPAEDLAGGLVCADDLPDGLVIADRVGRVTVFNRAASRLTGISPDSALGRDVQQVLPLRDGEDRCWWTQTRPYHGLSTRTRHPERPLYLPDGTELLVSVGYVRDWCRDGRADGEGDAPDGHTSETRDRWHHHPGAVRRLAITLRDAQRRSRAERNRADLVSTVAHELRSPLTSVKGFTATLLAKWPRFTDDQKRVMLETVNADADRVTRLWLDADKIFQILANLIENAVRHGAGTVTTMVESAQDAGAPGVTVSVRDQGQGIAPELAPRVFRQFWRVKRRGGAGLGLFIVKGLVEAHGGTIGVHQPPGGGAEFRFTMPAGTPDFG